MYDFILDKLQVGIGGHTKDVSIDLLPVIGVGRTAQIFPHLAVGSVLTLNKK